MPARPQAFGQLHVIINLPIHHRHHLAGFIAHRLHALGEINNRQPPDPQPDPARGKLTALIRPAMLQPVHRGHPMRLFNLSNVPMANDAAHFRNLFRAWRA